MNSGETALTAALALAIASTPLLDTNQAAIAAMRPQSGNCLELYSSALTDFDIEISETPAAIEEREPQFQEILANLICVAINEHENELEEDYSGTTTIDLYEIGRLLSEPGEAGMPYEFVFRYLKESDLSDNEIDELMIVDENGTPKYGAGFDFSLNLDYEDGHIQGIRLDMGNRPCNAIGASSSAGGVASSACETSNDIRKLNIQIINGPTGYSSRFIYTVTNDSESSIIGHQIAGGRNQTGNHLFFSELVSTGTGTNPTLAEQIELPYTDTIDGFDPRYIESQLSSYFSSN